MILYSTLEEHTTYGKSYSEKLGHTFVYSMITIRFVL